MAILRGIWCLLSSSERRGAVTLFLLMSVGMVLETFSVGLVVPLLAVLSKPDLTATSPFVQGLRGRLGEISQSELVIAGLLAFIAVYFVKTAFLAFLAWRQAWFSFSIQSSLSQRLFSHYLKLPYTFHLQRNSAELIRNVTLEVSTFSETLYFGIQLTTEILVLAGIGTLLLVVEPVGAIVVVGVLGVAGWGFLRLTRSRIAAWGLTAQYHQGQRLQHLHQGLGSVKEIKLLGREDRFIDLYGIHTTSALGAAQRQMTLQQFPRLWLELLAVGGLVTLVLTLVSQGRPADALLPTLGLFAAAAFRLMPSVTRVINAIQTLRFGLAAIGNLNRELPEEPGTKAQAATQQESRSSSEQRFSTAIEVKSLTYRYPDAKEPALCDVSLEIRCGESVGFIGASGAGKSTLIDILLGLLPAEAGAVLVDGRSIDANLRRWQNQIGYVPQSIYLTDDTLRRNVAFGLADAEIDEGAVWRAIRAAQLEEFVKSNPDGLDLMVGERGVRLSGGQRQRIGIARALYHDPAVLVLDEATSALDHETERGVMESIQAIKRGRTLILIAHRMTTLTDCDRLYRLQGGRLISERSYTENYPVKAAI
jgi:ABC-type multidrug transport system fused ATPase/permease subunit